jgi:isopropylmalate/homocitrate/citramalate synthase
VGDNLFTRESGAVANQFHIPEAIEPYSADIVGADRKIVLGKKSGLSSIRLKVEELGMDVAEESYPAILAEVKEKATAAGRLMTDDEFCQLVRDYPQS